MQASITRWLIVILLATIAVCLLFQAGVSVSEVRAQDTAAVGNGDVFAISGMISPQTYGLYLVDSQNKTIAVYQWLTSQRKLQLVAARSYAFDVQLEDYNTDKPPREIRDIVRQQQRLENITTQP